VTGTGAVSDWSAPCHFVTDHTPPAAPQVSSTDFPALGSGLPAPVARTTGTVHVAVSGAGSSDVVAVRYRLGDVIPVSGGTSVPVGPDGTASITITPTTWGLNTLYVQTQDRAGNLSGQVTYQFFVASATTVDARGDLNGDGTADLIATGTDGTLRTLLGKGDGTLAPAATYPDSPADFSTGLIAQNGDLDNDGYQDLLRITSTGVMERVSNNGLGDFRKVGLSFWRSDGSTWSAATQLVLPGPLDGSANGDILTVENGHLLLWPRTSIGITGTSTDLGGGYEHTTVLAPGDLTHDGIPDLLMRDDVTGRLWVAPGTGTGTLAPTEQWISAGKGFTAADFPLLTVVGDANGDGQADLYGVTSDGVLDFVPGTNSGHFGPAVEVSGTGLDWSAVNGLA
jgi:hypothetical protein